MKILNWFKEKFPDEVLAMKQCEHEIDGIASDYHSEGSVWTHTMMCYGEVRNQSDQIKLLILIHDIAKADTQVDKGRGWYSFTGHEFLGCFKAIRVLEQFEKDFGFIDKENILRAINDHQVLFKLGKMIDGELVLDAEEIQFLHSRYGNSLALWDMLIALMEADFKGRFAFDYDKGLKQIAYFKEFIPYKYEKNRNEYPHFVMLAGVQCSGKSTIAEKYKDYLYLSNDAVLMEGKTGTYEDNYSEKNREKAILKVKERLKEAVKKRINIIIDNTNIDEIARNRLLDIVPDKYYFKEAINVIAKPEVLKKRAQERVGKRIPGSVIDKGMRNFSFIGEDKVDRSIVIISS